MWFSIIVLNASVPNDGILERLAPMAHNYLHEILAMQNSALCEFKFEFFEGLILELLSQTFKWRKIVL